MVLIVGRQRVNAVAAFAAATIVAVLAPQLASAGLSDCPGDCNGNRAVAINELIVGVNIALGQTPVATCAAFDQDANGTVSIGELIRAVNAALSGGCEPTVATPTEASTPPTAPATSTPEQTETEPASETSTPTATLPSGSTTTPTPVPTSVTLYIGSVSGQPGSTATLEVSLATAGMSVAGTQNEIQFDSRARIRSTSGGRPDCSTDVEDREVRSAFLPVGCDPATTCQSVRVVVITFTFAPLPDGAVLYSCEVEIANDAGAPGVSLGCANPRSGSLPPITRLTTECLGGTVTTGGSQTASADLPGTGTTGGLPADECWGDCRGLGYPELSDVRSVIGVALGEQLATCPPADTEGDLMVDILDVLRALQVYVYSCLA